MTHAITIESVEMRAANAQEIRAAASQIPKDLQAYFEIPLSPLSRSNDLESSLAAIAEAGARAKVRTGGEAPEMFPTGADLARFFTLCKAAGVPFKASAGLHRPVRGEQRYTYKPDSASGTMHGFLNVFLAAAMVRDGMPEPDATELLAEQSPKAFLWEEQRRRLAHPLHRQQAASRRAQILLPHGRLLLLRRTHRQPQSYRLGLIRGAPRWAHSGAEAPRSLVRACPSRAGKFSGTLHRYLGGNR